MSMTAVLSLTYRIVITMAAFYALLRFKRLDTATRIICMLIWLGWITETTGYFTAKYFRNNYIVFNSAFYLEFTLIVMYYHYSIPVLRKRKYSIGIIAAGAILGILNNFFLQPLTAVISSNLLFMECLLVSCLSFVSIQHMLASDQENLRLHRKAHFWIVCILLLYQSATVSSWGLYDKMEDKEQKKACILDILILAINIVTYLSYVVVLFYYSKLKQDEY